MIEEDDDVRFVGRGAELDRLARLLERASTGSPVVAVVSGPAGIGKTTLLHRFLRRQSPARVRQVAGLAWERHRPAALVRRLAATTPGGPVPGGPVPVDTALPGAVPGGAVPVEGELPAGEDPGEWGEALARRWRADAAGGPLVVVIDDVQDADPVSAQAITSAVARLGGARVLLLLGRGLPAVPLPVGPTMPAAPFPAGPTVPAATARGPFPPGAVADALDRLPAVVIPVPALRPEDVRLLAARTAGVDLPLTIARRLWAHTCGIPRHLLEILRDSPPARWSDWQTRLPAPPSVLAEIAVVLRCCAPATRALVEAAAVLGPAPVLADVAALAGVADPVGALDEAFAAGLLAPVAGHGLDALSFPGPYVRAAVYATLGPVRRRQLHLGAAAILTDETDRLRHRVEAAPLPDDTLAAELLDLARRKADEGAWTVVAGVLTDAARISRSRADRESRLIEAVNALAGAGLLGQAVDALPDIEALPTSARRDAALAYVAVQRGRRTSAAAYLETAWRACRDATGPGHGPDETAALVCQLQVLHALAEWDGDGLVHWARQAIEHAEPGSPAAVESRAILGLGHGMCGEIDAAFASYRAAIAECPRGPQLQRARMGLGWLHLAQDDPAAARRELEFAVPTVRQTGSNRISLWALGWLARTRFALGDWPGALDAVDQGEALLAATGLHLVRPLVHWTAAQIHALRGEAGEAERHLRLGAASDHDYTVMAVPALLARAHVAEAVADYPAVVRHLTPLVTRSPRGGLDEPGFWPWPDLYATALIFTGRLDEAETFLVPFEELVASRRHRSASARLAVVRGRLLGARGDIAGAERAFATARDHLCELLLPYERARLDFAHGLTLRRAGRRRDAAALLETARQEFDALGAKVLVQRCERELKTGRQAARGLAEAGLTEQERTVSELVAKGMTNKEVAAEMMLSVKTVQFHLTRIYAKLGLRSRSELAASLRPAP